MAVTTEDLDFIAPGLANVPDVDKQKAIDKAAAYRPACLSEEKQDEAQLNYAAWLLYDRERQKAAAASAAGALILGAKRIKEGDVEIEFATIVDGQEVLDPYGFFARWRALNKICSAGAILVGNGARRGCGC